MPLFGAHVSIAGGLPRAIDRALASGCEAFQIFTKSSSQWRARPLPDREIEEFRQRRAASGLAHALAHDSYLINVAAPDPTLRNRSIAALGEEIDRAEALDLDGLVMHPGAFTSGSGAAGVRLVAEALARLLDSRPGGRTLILLEHTAGQGTVLGSRFEQLAEILDWLGGSPRLGICLDTCHLVASGYDLASENGYRETFEAFRTSIGFERLKLFHLNDSRTPRGSRVDRHEHIGRGHVGLDGFRRLVNDPRFAGLPMVLETPKSADGGRQPADPWDRRNLRILRTLAGAGALRPGRAPEARRTPPLRTGRLSRRPATHRRRGRP